MAYNKRMLHQPLRGLDGLSARASLQNRRKCGRKLSLEFKLKIFLLIALFFAASFSIAESKNPYERSGSVNTSVNATNQEGFDCANKSGRSYLLGKLPVYFSTEFGKAGLLQAEHVGKYKLAIVINKDSKIVGYQVAPNTNEKSLLVQTIVNMGSLPALNRANACIADKPFIFEFTIT